MAMLIAWAFCNRGKIPTAPSSLMRCWSVAQTSRSRSVCRSSPGHQKNYYAEFDIVPVKYRPLMQKGKVWWTNWHRFNPRSEHEEGGKTYAVVNKGPETAGDLRAAGSRATIRTHADHGAERRRASLLAPEAAKPKDRGDDKSLEEEAEEATVWVEGLTGLITHPGHHPGMHLRRSVRDSLLYQGQWTS